MKFSVRGKAMNFPNRCKDPKESRAHSRACNAQPLFPYVTKVGEATTTAVSFRKRDVVNVTSETLVGKEKVGRNEERDAFPGQRPQASQNV